MADADAAPHRVATHRRAALSFESIARGRKYIAIHEDASDLLRPMAETSAGLEKVAEVARAAKDEESRFGESTTGMTARLFFQRMEDAAHLLLDLLRTSDQTASVATPPPATPPRQHQARLYEAMTAIGIFPTAEPMRIVQALAAGELAEIIVRVDRTLAPGRRLVTHRAIVAVWSTAIPEKAACWIADATSRQKDIEAMAGRPVADRTPQGRLQDAHPIVQIPSLDIKRRTPPARVVAILEAALAEFASYRQVGIVIDRKHVSVVVGTNKVANLAECFRRRIVKVEHYRGGASRGSNNWIGKCDMLLVAGSPRVPPSAIRTRLIQSSWAAAAARDGRWEKDWWSGIDTTGKRHTVAAAAYRDHDWHNAHLAMVHAELLQAIGRGRTVCENGIPVVVLSNENLGLFVHPKCVAPMPDRAVEGVGTVATLMKPNPTDLGPSQE